MKNLLLAFLLAIPALSLTGQVHLELRAAPGQPVLLGEGAISTPANERDLAIDSRGRELYFTVSTPLSALQTIVVMKRLPGGAWSLPEAAPFSGRYSDLEPAFSPDGQRLYFASNRPVEGTAPKDFDIWYVERRSDGKWGSPRPAGPPVNTPADEFYPSVAHSGNLYFTAMYEGGIGREDIYVARWENEAFQKPEPLDTAVNSARYEFNAYVSPDESFILFTSYGRPDDLGGGDLYISLRDTDGRWLPARHLGDLNSPRLDYCPYVGPDGQTLFFTSERHNLPRFLPEAATYEQIRQTYNVPLNGLGNLYQVHWPGLLERIRRETGK